MSFRPRKIQISKIVTDLRYYPRVTVDQGRVREFVELLEYGTHFPPIKVVRDPVTGRYILLDGKHRLEAYILRGEVEIFADIMYIPEEHWLMSSARFNSKSSKPLTGNETKNIIIITWNNGIKDTDVIAHEMGCTPRYVEMVLKPVRDEERNKRKEKILKLHRQGKSQREISTKLGFAVSAINKTLKLGNEAQSESLETDQVFSKRNNFVLRTPCENNNNNQLDDPTGNISSNSINRPFQDEMEIGPDDESQAETSQQSDTILSDKHDESFNFDDAQVFSKRSNFVLRTPNKKNDISMLKSTPEEIRQNFQPENPANSPEIEPEKPPGENADQVFTKRNDFVLEIPDEDCDIEELESDHTELATESAKIPEETSTPEEDPAGNENQTEEPSAPQNASPYPSYMNQIDLYNELTPQGQHAIRAMELAKKYKVDITYIAQEIGEPLEWTKKVLLSAIALSLMHGDKISDISNVETTIGISYYIAEAIQAMLPFHTMLCPVAPEMEQWITDNLSAQDLDVILALVDAKKKDLPYLLKGEKPPETKRNCFEQLPDAYKKQLQAYITVLREIRDHAKNKRFNQDSAKQLMVHLNKNVIVLNEIFDGLREDQLV